jgi:carboxymethylenebutenolidase
MTVTENPIEIPMTGGTAEAFVYRPEGEGPWPGVLHLSDIWGIRPDRKAMARRQAADGYVVLMPNIFWRLTVLPVFDFKPEFGEARTMSRLGELRTALTPPQMSEDAGVYLDFLAGQRGVKPGAMGVVGYCFTGAMAMRAAAVRPDAVAAAASFHGGGLANDTPESPHRLLPQIKARLYFAHAVEDRSMPADMIEKLEAALKAWGGRYESETYDGAHHGWTIPGPVYNEAQAERHFEKLKALFAETL